MNNIINVNLLLTILLLIGCFQSKEESLLEEIQSVESKLLQTDQELKDLSSMPTHSFSLKDMKQYKQEIRTAKKDIETHKLRRTELMKTYNDLVSEDKI